jgi:hypothetical protein
VAGSLRVLRRQKTANPTEMVGVTCPTEPRVDESNGEGNDEYATEGETKSGKRSHESVMKATLGRRMKNGTEAWKERRGRQWMEEPRRTRTWKESAAGNGDKEDAPVKGISGLVAKVGQGPEEKREPNGRERRIHAAKTNNQESPRKNCPATEHRCWSEMIRQTHDEMIPNTPPECQTAENTKRAAKELNPNAWLRTHGGIMNCHKRRKKGHDGGGRNRESLSTTVTNHRENET